MLGLKVPKTDHILVFWTFGTPEALRIAYNFQADGTFRRPLENIPFGLVCPWSRSKAFGDD